MNASVTGAFMDPWQRALSVVPAEIPVGSQSTLGSIPRATCHLLRRAVAAVRSDLDPVALDMCVNMHDLQSLVATATEAQACPLHATLRSRLRPILPSDYGWLYQALITPQLAAMYFDGRTPRPEDFPATLWANTSVVYVVADRYSAKNHGLVTVANDHPEAGFCNVSAVRCTDGAPGDFGIMLDGLIELITHLFETTRMRKVYVWVPEWTLGYLAGIDDDLLQPEGILRDHLWYRGRRWAEHRYTLWRDGWEAWTRRWPFDAGDGEHMSDVSEGC